MRARELGHVLHDSVRRSNADDIFGLASQAAFSFAFSLFPILLLLMAVIGMLGQNPAFIATARDSLAPFVPPDVLALLFGYIETLETPRPRELISISVLLTLWASSGVVAAFMKAVNRAYDAERDRPFLRKRLRAILIISLSGLLVVVAFLIMVFGPVAGTVLHRYFGLGQVYDRLFDVLRFPFSLIVLSVAFGILYRLGPYLKNQWYEVVPGALLATWLWMTATFMFSLYVERFGKFDKTYGSLGALIILLAWMYLTSLVIIYGAEFNAAFGAWLRRRRAAR